MQKFYAELRALERLQTQGEFLFEIVVWTYRVTATSRYTPSHVHARMNINGTEEDAHAAQLAFLDLVKIREGI